MQSSSIEEQCSCTEGLLTSLPAVNIPRGLCSHLTAPWGVSYSQECVSQSLASMMIFSSVIISCIQKSETKPGVWMAAFFETNSHFFFAEIHSRLTVLGKFFQEIKVTKLPQTLCLPALSVISGTSWHGMTGSRGSPLAFPTHPLLVFILFHNASVGLVVIDLSLDKTTQGKRRKHIIFEILFRRHFLNFPQCSQTPDPMKFFLECDTSQTWSRSDKHFRSI